MVPCCAPQAKGPWLCEGWKIVPHLGPHPRRRCSMQGRASHAAGILLSSCTGSSSSVRSSLSLANPPFMVEPRMEGMLVLLSFDVSSCRIVHGNGSFLQIMQPTVFRALSLSSVPTMPPIGYATCSSLFRWPSKQACRLFCAVVTANRHAVGVPPEKT